jgi:hypothetical protein
LTAEEKAVHKKMIELDGMGEEEDEEFSWKACASVLSAPQAWLVSVGTFLTGASNFLVPPVRSHLDSDVKDL